MLRRATRDDVAGLPGLERAAGEMFRPLGMDAIADDEPPSHRWLRAAVAAGSAWVVDVGGVVVAYLVARTVDGCAHVEQVTVHPDHARRGWGAALVEELALQASAAGLPALTLTTFRDVPWNGPYYERLGFYFLPDAEVTPGLRARREEEAARGLDRWPRACMRRELSSPRSAPRPAT